MALYFNIATKTYEPKVIFKGVERDTGVVHQIPVAAESGTSGIFRCDVETARIHTAGRPIVATPVDADRGIGNLVVVDVALLLHISLVDPSVAQFGLGDVVVEVFPVIDDVFGILEEGVGRVVPQYRVRNVEHSLDRGGQQQIYVDDDAL